MKLVYFAWVRERIGKSEEEIALPAEVVTVADLLAWLRRAAKDMRMRCEQPKSSASRSTRSMSTTSAPLAGAREIALFPPMTGG